MKCWAAFDAVSRSDKPEVKVGPVGWSDKVRLSEQTCREII